VLSVQRRDEIENDLRFSPRYAPAAGALRSCPGLAVEDAQWQERVSELVACAAIVVIECTWNGPGLSWELETCLSTKADRTIVVCPDAGAPNYSDICSEQVSKFTRLVSAAHVADERLFYHPLTHDLFLGTQTIAMASDEERRRVRFETSAAPPVTYHGTLRRLLELGDDCYEREEYDYAAIYWSRMPRVFLHRHRHQLLEEEEPDIYAAACLRLARFSATTDFDLARDYLRAAADLKPLLSAEAVRAIDDVSNALGAGA